MVYTYVKSIHALESTKHDALLLRTLQLVLTVNADFDSLADGGRDAIGGDTQVGAHIETTNASQLKHLTLPLRHCNEMSDNIKHEEDVTKLQGRIVR
jgi:hypothetical protein